MKLLWLSVLLALVQNFSLIEGRAANSSRIPGDLWSKVQERGTLRVIVEFDMPWQVEARLSSSERSAQRKNIAANQTAIRGELGKSVRRVTGLFQTVNAIGLEVDSRGFMILSNSRRIKSIVEDLPETVQISDTVPLIGATAAWTSGSGYTGNGWTIAIIDSGVDRSHSFFSNKIVDEACFSSLAHCPNGDVYQQGLGAAAPCTYNAQCSHGTMVAGIAAGKGVTFSGVAKDANIMALQVFNNVSGAMISYSVEQVLALERVLAKRTELSIAAVNMSIGTGTRYPDQAACDAANPTRKQAVDNLRAVGIPTIISGGNDSDTTGLTSPGCISSAVSVSSTTKGNAISTFSNTAPYLSLLAPGGFNSEEPFDSDDIHTSVPGGGYADGAGSSLAAPHVSGAWAILKQKNASASVGQILNALQTTGVRITDSRSGANSRVHCRINVGEAVNNIPAVFVTLDFAEAAATGINNCGQIVGTSYNGWAGTGFITDTRDSATALVYNGPISGEYYGTYAFSINNKGEVHGSYCCDDWDVGFTRSAAGSYSKFASNPNTNTIFGNNDYGDFVGWFWDGEWYGYYGTYIDSATDLSDTESFYDVNNMRRMVGLNASGAIIVDENGTPSSPYNYGGSGFTEFYGINESGHVVGCYWPSGGGGTGFMKKPNAAATAINTGSSTTCAMGINDSGQVVGYYEDGGGTWKAFVDLSW